MKQSDSVMKRELTRDIRIVFIQTKGFYRVEVNGVTVQRMKMVRHE